VRIEDRLILIQEVERSILGTESSGEKNEGRLEQPDRL
jgi:hypothetical protein